MLLIVLRRLLQTAGVILVSIVTNSNTFDLPFGILIAILAMAIHAFVLPYKEFSLDVLQMCVLSNQILVLFSMYVDQYADFGIQMGYAVTALQFGLLIVFLIYIVPFFWAQIKAMIESGIDRSGNGDDEEKEEKTKENDKDEEAEDNSHV